MSYTYLILNVVVCWSTTMLVVTDSIFEGTRAKVLSVLAKRKGIKVITRAAEFANERSARADARLKVLEVPLVRLNHARDQMAVLSMVGWGFAWLAMAVIAEVRHPRFLVTIALRSLQLWRFIAEKLWVGIQCPFCVSLWVAIGIAARVDKPFTQSLFEVSLIGGGSRLLFELTCTARSVRKFLEVKKNGGSD